MPRFSTAAKSDKSRHAANGSVKAKGKPAKKESLWKGPEIDGISFSMLSRFLVCRERFRLYAVEGLKEKESFNVRLEYGNMVHVCEEATAAGIGWMPPLLEYVKGLVRKYGNADSQQISHWFSVCCAQYPVYLKFWSKQKDVLKRKPIYQEKVFDVPYQLSSGRTVRLRGKWDSVDVIGKGIYLQENKARGEIIPDKMLAELPSDLQTNMYLTALSLAVPYTIEEKDLAKFIGLQVKPEKLQVAGFRYNILRRPLSGGKYNIKQLEGRGKEKKGAETAEQFYTRLKGLIEEDPQHFFFRWKIETTPDDLTKFQQRTLNPILETLYDWWEWISVDPFDPWRERSTLEFNSERECLKWATQSNPHFVCPTGVYNSTLEGRQSPYDELIMNGRATNLAKADSLFEELRSA